MRIFAKDAAQGLLGKKHQSKKVQPHFAKSPSTFRYNSNKDWQLNARDFQDIESCIKNCNVSEVEIKGRVLLVLPTFFGPEENYRYHLDLVIERFFKK